MIGDRHIPLEVAHRFLARFGITSPTKTYERWVGSDGFTLDGFHDVLAESRFVFHVDWRTSLGDELPSIIEAVGELGSQLDVDGSDDGCSACVHCNGNRDHVKYSPTDDDDFTDVILTIGRLVPETIEFRGAPSNAFNDGWEFAVLLRDEWSELETIDRQLTSAMFLVLPALQGPDAT